MVKDLVIFIVKLVNRMPHGEAEVVFREHVLQKLVLFDVLLS